MVLVGDMSSCLKLETKTAVIIHHAVFIHHLVIFCVL